jgi:GAF domain-containing protein
VVPALPHSIGRPLIGMWLATSAHSWRRRMMADDSPHVHARGTNPDRILLAGDGAAAGRGVLTHELGLPGFLARSLSAHTGRATDVDIVVTADMTARSCLAALERADLFRFDVIVLCLGGNEALALLALPEWRSHLTSLLDDLEDRAPVATQIYLLSVPVFSSNPYFPDRLAEVVDRHVHDLNRVMQEVADTCSRVRVIPLTHISMFELEGPHLYQRWADGISDRISGSLDPVRSTAARAGVLDEVSRQRAFDDMHLQDTGEDPILDSLTESARHALGTSIAAISFIDGDTQFMRSVRGMEHVSLTRDQSFCDITIRHAAGLVIEDAQADPRYAAYSTVIGEPHIRFYAGYPIESPDGHRIGALCVLDTVPRTVTALDRELLRTLAHYVQEHLWQESARHSPPIDSSAVAGPA